MEALAQLALLMVVFIGLGNFLSAYPGFFSFCGLLLFGAIVAISFAGLAVMWLILGGLIVETIFAEVRNMIVPLFYKRAAPNSTEDSVKQPMLSPPAVTVNLSGCVCSVCGNSLEARVVWCSACKTPHHDECWEYNSRCSVFACGQEKCISAVPEDLLGDKKAQAYVIRMD